MTVILNDVTFTGYTTQQVELRNANGRPAANFSLGQTRRFKKADNSMGEETNFIDCEVYGAGAETLAKYAGQGTGLLVRGRLKQNRWTDQNQVKHSRVVIVVASWQFNDKNKVIDKAPEGPVDGQEE